MANTKPKTGALDNASIKAARSKKGASGCGVWVLVILALAWIPLLIFGPFALFDKVDIANSGTFPYAGQVTLISKENVNGGTFNVLTIKPATGTDVKAVVPDPVYAVATANCASGNCYAEAAFEANDALLTLSLYQTQGGAKLADLKNHSQAKDDVEIAIGIAIAWAIVTLLTVIVWYVIKNTSKKNPSSSTAIARLHWDGHGFPPQGGVTPDSKWYAPPPSAAMLASGKPLEAIEAPNTNWPNVV
jgi:hypothetical protein